MKTKSNTLLNRVDTRLAACAAAAAATVAVAPQSQAAVVYSGMVNLNVPSTTSGIYLNVVTGTATPTTAASPGWDLNPWQTASLSIWANNAASPNDGVIAGVGSSASLVDNLALGFIVDGTGTYVRTGSTETTGSTAFTLNGTSNYFGFRFLNETTGIINFGWAQITLGTTPGAQPRTLVDYAYDNTGGSIMIGQTSIPEPTTLGLLGLAAAGAFGVRVWRGRKTA